MDKNNNEIDKLKKQVNTIAKILAQLDEVIENLNLNDYQELEAILEEGINE